MHTACSSHCWKDNLLLTLSRGLFPQQWQLPAKPASKDLSSCVNVLPLIMACVAMHFCIERRVFHSCPLLWPLPCHTTTLQGIELLSSHCRTWLIPNTSRLHESKEDVSFFHTFAACHLACYGMVVVAWLEKVKEKDLSGFYHSVWQEQLCN